MHREFPLASELLANPLELPHRDHQQQLRRAARNHAARAESILDRAADAGRELQADERRRAEWHTEQADALRRADDCYGIDLDQILEPQQHRSPDAEAGYLPDATPSRRAAEDVLRDGEARGLISTRGADTLTRLMDAGPMSSRSVAARWAAACGDPAYLRAFATMVSDPNHGHLRWSPEEREAWRRAQDVQAEFRYANEAVPGSGGYAVPVHLSPTVLLSSDGVTAPLRQLSRVETITTDTWHGLTSDGVTGEWLGEGVEAALADATIVQPPVPLHKASCYVEWSYELGGDAVALVNQLQDLIRDEMIRLTETSYTVGTGIGQPTGIITALAAVAASVVAPTAAEAFAAADVYKVQAALPPRFQAGASWGANVRVLHLIDQMETTNGAKLFPEVGVGGGSLLRRDVTEFSLMDGVWDTAVTANNYILLYAAFREAFVIADHVAGGFEPIPVVVGTSHRPTGKRGLQYWARTGSNVVVPNAARVLNLATTA